MGWWGKIVGGAFGYMLGGPLGALLGAALGHHFDRGLAALPPPETGPDQERIQSAFFTATFSVMGHVSKADGRVSEDEIEAARAVMRRMSLDDDQIRVAVNLFNQGKRPEFDLDAVLAQFRSECHRRRTLMQMFLEIQLQAAYADGEMHRDEARVLKTIAERLGFSDAAFRQLEAIVRAERFFTGSARPKAEPPRDLLADAYALLGIDRKASDAELKKAYRRLMAQHHPDKLIAKGLPEEMVKLATEKTQEIRSAYELIKEQRARRR